MFFFRKRLPVFVKLSLGESLGTMDADAFEGLLEGFKKTLGSESPSLAGEKSALGENLDRVQSWTHLLDRLEATPNSMLVKVKVAHYSAKWMAKFSTFMKNGKPEPDNTRQGTLNIFTLCLRGQIPKGTSPDLDAAVEQLGEAYTKASVFLKKEMRSAQRSGNFKKSADKPEAVLRRHWRSAPVHQWMVSIQDCLRALSSHLLASAGTGRKPAYMVSLIKEAKAILKR
ncbi:MAG: hypothetical protein ACI9BD_000503 [Candidatus Marinamargulisbacteria bacterium]|jgi:hypothetical protein